MLKSRTLPNNSFVKGTMPISCVMCQEGSKMVLLVTGLCSYDCYYCPLSLEKQGKSLTYANEKLVADDRDVIFEAKSIGARGTGITGGDPLIEMKKTLRYIRLLKRKFGKRHNIHLYTSTPDIDKIGRLAEAGLDEIRFHPPLRVWDCLEKTDYPAAIKKARCLKLKTGIEIPAIPKTAEKILKLINSAKAAGAQFVNLNELEFSESNWQELKKRKFRIKDDVSSAVSGSEETAYKVIRADKSGITIHYCSSSFKDATQLRKRIMRRAKNTAMGLEIITPDGTFVKGVVECPNPKTFVKSLSEDFDISSDLIRVDSDKNRVEIAAWILEEIYKEIGCQSFIVEEYPTADRLEVERRPLK